MGRTNGVTRVSSHLAAPDRSIPIRACTYKPRLARYPLHLQHSKPFLYLMPTQDLEWDNKRVRHQVVVDPCMEDLDRAVVGRRREQRVRRVELYRAQCTREVPVVVCKSVSVSVSASLLESANGVHSRGRGRRTDSEHASSDML